MCICIYIRYMYLEPFASKDPSCLSHLAAMAWLRRFGAQPGMALGGEVPSKPRRFDLGQAECPSIRVKHWAKCPG